MTISAPRFGAVFRTSRAFVEQASLQEQTDLELPVILRGDEISALGREGEEDRMNITVDSMAYDATSPLLDMSPYPRDMSGYADGDRLDVAHINVKEPAMDDPLAEAVGREFQVGDLGPQEMGAWIFRKKGESGESFVDTVITTAREFYESLKR